MSSPLPDYVERGGREVLRQPFLGRDTRLFGFVLQADQAALDDLLFYDFTVPTDGALDLRCAHPNVVITFAEIQRLSSLDPVDARVGYILEREVSVWCLAADVKSRRLLWYLPYIFTDSGSTVATGREIYGFPKQLGEFDPNFLDDLQAGGTATVRSRAIAHYSPDSPSEMRPMISVTPTGPLIPSVAGSFEDEIKLWFTDPPRPARPRTYAVPSATQSAAITPVGASPPPPRAIPPWIDGLLSALKGELDVLADDALLLDLIRGPRAIFLKQFRDATQPNKACYQAVIEAPIEPDYSKATVQLLTPDDFTVTVENYDSEPLATDLGILGQTPVRAFKADNFNFTIEPGTEIWRAPT